MFSEACKLLNYNNLFMENPRYCMQHVTVSKLIKCNNIHRIILVLFKIIMKFCCGNISFRPFFFQQQYILSCRSDLYFTVRIFDNIFYKKVRRV